MLRRAIASALAQTGPSLQVCVYDNAGDPENGAVVAGFADTRVRYLRHETNGGVHSNFQFGLTQLSTAFFSFLADDDFLLPGFYAGAMAALAAEGEAMFAMTQVVLVDGAGRTLGIDGMGWRPGLYRPPAGLLTMVRRGHINWTGILFRREVLSAVPALDPRTSPSFDLDFELRLAGRCPFVVCASRGAVMVHHPDSASARARLDDTWPSHLVIIENAATAPMSADERVQVRGALERQLGGRVYRIGRAAARQGDIDDADRAAAVIVERYGWRRRAALIRLAARFCAAVPTAQPALRLALNAYRSMRSRQLRGALGGENCGRAEPVQGWASPRRYNR